MKSLQMFKYGKNLPKNIQAIFTQYRNSYITKYKQDISKIKHTERVTNYA